MSYGGRRISFEFAKSRRHRTGDCSPPAWDSTHLHQCVAKAAIRGLQLTGLQYRNCTIDIEPHPRDAEASPAMSVRLSGRLKSFSTAASCEQHSSTHYALTTAT